MIHRAKASARRSSHVFNKFQNKTFFEHTIQIKPNKETEMVASHPELYASADNADFVNKVFFKRPQLHPDAGEEGLKKR